ncbi:MAG: deoxyguanosinetriphosphate triphosphohydrolase [Firmicutes bacterium ADurb.Bin373]|nr:MAG: deoxyguanosinetriphosphate triphosphohydrolase [Firmicutes bacterium ADurb.Bin373]
MVIKKYEIRDPIYGFIELDSWERDIINHPAFQRLRRIKQLAWTDMVYPGAVHTRFEHSLGVMHLATLMYEKIVNKKKDYLENKLGYNGSGLENDKKFVRLAALLHDVGHSPFSHAGEGLMDTNPDTDKPYKHENYSAAIVEHKFKKVIDEHPFNQNYHITAKQISDFLVGGAGLGRRLFWRSLVTGQIDADRADYLLRDAYHIGTNYGSYDLKRLLVTLTIAEHPETGAPMIAVEEGGLHAAEALIIARYMMFTQVYFHHTRRAYDHHFAGAMKSLLLDVAKQETFLPPTSQENIDDYISWDDWKVLGLLSQGKGGEDGYALKERKHHRCVFYTSEVPTETELDRSNEVLEELSRFKPFVDEPKKSWYSEGESDIMIESDIAPDQKETVPLSSISSVVRGLLPIRRRRIYVSLGNQKEAELLLNRKGG